MSFWLVELAFVKGTIGGEERGAVAPSGLAIAGTIAQHHHNQPRVPIIQSICFMYQYFELGSGKLQRP